jgi:hypothetical protein
MDKLVLWLLLVVVRCCGCIHNRNTRDCCLVNEHVTCPNCNKRSSKRELCLLLSMESVACSRLAVYEWNT